MASRGTSVPSAAETRRWRTRDPVRVSIWLKRIVRCEMAGNSFTGMETSPKLMDPDQMAFGMT